MGYFEQEEYCLGTKKICELINENKGLVIVGGGDTLNAMNKYKLNKPYLSTGGGASLFYLENNYLVGVVE